MQRVYSNRINWENEPSQNTPINENNLNKMDYALFTIDGRVCDLELTKANQSDLLLGVKNVDYDTSTGVFTFEWQNGTRKTVDLNIEKIPVSFSLDADGVIRMKTADGTVFTADISQTLKQYNFVDSSVIDFTESVDGEGNKVVTADIIGGSITAEKLQPNFLADCKEAKETAETKALVSEGYAVGEQNGVPVDETSPYYHNNAKYFSDKSASTIYQQSNWNETDATQSAYIHNKPFNSLDQNDFEVVNGILKTKAQAIDSLNDITDVDVASATNGEVLTYENNKWVNKKASGGLLPRLVITTEAGAIVTAEKDGTILSVTNNEIDVPEFGTWVVKSFINGEYAIVNVVVDSVKIYNVNAMHFSATINVTAPSGSRVTITNGTETYIKESAPYSFEVRTSGYWSIECKLDEATKISSVTIENNGDVKEASFTFAMLTVNYDDEFIGKSISVTDGTRTYSKWANGNVVFAIANYGTWTVSAVVDGDRYEVEININSDTEYSVELLYKKGLDYTEWLSLAGISQSYASLDDVLADEKALRILFTKHASVDYLASIEEENEDVTKIIYNDICAKWINLRDYALDTLYANPILKAEMDTADKYFYGEWVEIDGVWQPKGNVPVMTSNNAPYGEASGDNPYSANYGWYAFDGNPSTFYACANANSGTLTYKFVNPVCIKKMYMECKNPISNIPKTYRILASNDGSAWTELYSATNDTSQIKNISFDNDNYYLYYSFNTSATTQDGALVNTLQFYGRELKVSVPKMTSDNAPWGEVTSSGGESATSNRPYQAFDKDTSSAWMVGNRTNSFVKYEFPAKTLIKYLSYIALKSGETTNVTTHTDHFYGSADGNEWFELGSFEMNTSKQKTLNVVNITTEREIKFIKYETNSATMTNGYTSICELNVFGLDYSEHQERHYIYDHGVELENNITTIGNVTKESNQVVVSSAGNVSTYDVNGIDLTSFSLARLVVGNMFASGTSGGIQMIKNGSIEARLYDSSMASMLPYNVYLDITSLNGEYNVRVATTDNAKNTITEWWLE